MMHCNRIVTVVLISTVYVLLIYDVSEPKPEYLIRQKIQFTEPWHVKYGNYSVEIEGI